MTHPQAITPNLRPLINAFIAREWHGTIMLVRGEVVDMTCLDGFTCVEKDEIKGLITYFIRGGVCEIVSLNSQSEGRGMGTALLNLVIDAARKESCHCLQLLTTNDNLNAIGFYQKRGFQLAGVNLWAIDREREIKPAIPLVGQNGIPMHHEIEFEMEL